MQMIESDGMPVASEKQSRRSSSLERAKACAMCVSAAARHLQGKPTDSKQAYLWKWERGWLTSIALPSCARYTFISASLSSRKTGGEERGEAVCSMR